MNIFGQAFQSPKNINNPVLLKKVEGKNKRHFSEIKEKTLKNKIVIKDSIDDPTNICSKITSKNSFFFRDKENLKCLDNCRAFKLLSIYEREIKNLSEANLTLKNINEMLINSINLKDGLLLELVNDNKNLKFECKYLNTKANSKNKYDPSTEQTSKPQQNISASLILNINKNNLSNTNSINNNRNFNRNAINCNFQNNNNNKNCSIFKASDSVIINDECCLLRDRLNKKQKHFPHHDFKKNDYSENCQNFKDKKINNKLNSKTCNHFLTHKPIGSLTQNTDNKAKLHKSLLNSNYDREENASKDKNSREKCNDNHNFNKRTNIENKRNPIFYNKNFMIDNSSNAIKYKFLTPLRNAEDQTFNRDKININNSNNIFNTYSSFNKREKSILMDSKISVNLNENHYNSILEITNETLTNISLVGKKANESPIPYKEKESEKVLALEKINEKKTHEQNNISINRKKPIPKSSTIINNRNFSNEVIRQTDAVLKYEEKSKNCADVNINISTAQDITISSECKKSNSKKIFFNYYEELKKIRPKIIDSKFTTNPEFSLLKLSDKELESIISENDFTKVKYIADNSEKFIEKFKTASEIKLLKICDKYYSIICDFESTVNLIIKLRNFLTFTANLSSYLLLEEFSELICKKIRELFTCEKAEIFMYNSLTDFYIVFDSDGKQKNLSNKKNNQANYLLNEVFTTGNLIRINNINDNEKILKMLEEVEHQEKDSEEKMNTLENFLIAPLKETDKLGVFGALQLTNRKKSLFTNDDCELLNLFARQISRIYINAKNNSENNSYLAKYKNLLFNQKKFKESIKNFVDLETEISSILVSVFSSEYLQFIVHDDKFTKNLFKITKFELKEIKKDIGIVGHVFNTKEYFGVNSINESDKYNNITDLDTGMSLLTYPILYKNEIKAIFQFSYNEKLAYFKKPKEMDEILINFIIFQCENWFQEHDSSAFYEIFKDHQENSNNFPNVNDSF